MALLDYNEITLKKFIVHDGDPYEVVETHVSRKQMGKPSNKTKLKNLINGRVIEITFHAADTAQEADISKKQITYVFYNEKKQEHTFSDVEDPKNRFALTDAIVGREIRFIKEKTILEAKVYTDKGDKEMIIGIRYPQKVELIVTEAPPSIRGDTATGGNKLITVETGAQVNAPLFIEVGEIIRVNTETGEYSERVSK